MDLQDERPINNLIDDAGEQQLRDFLKEILPDNQRLAKRFRISVSKVSDVKDVGFYQLQVDQICQAYMGRHHYIRYYDAPDFSIDIAKFIDEDVKTLIKNQQNMTALEVINYIVVKLANIDSNDDGEIAMLGDDCAKAWRQILQQADLTLKRIAFDWFQKHLDGSLELFESTIEDVMFSEFTEDEFLTTKLNWTDQELQQARKSQNIWTVQQLGEQWAMYHLQVLEQAHASDDVVREFCTANLDFSKVRFYYVNRCVQKKNYSTAIKLLIDGQQNDHISGSGAEYSQELKRLYKQLGKSADYRHELWLLVSNYEPANIKYYRELKALYSKNEWPGVREKLFNELPEFINKNQLYAADHLYKPLLASVLAMNDLSEMQKYENVLTPKYSKQLLEKYVTIVQAKAEEARSRKYYRQLVQILNHMLTLPGGTVAATPIAKAWQEEFKRRPAMIEELQAFGKK